VRFLGGEGRALLSAMREIALARMRSIVLMRAGDRVELLRKLASRLSQSDYPWEDMELVLGQFGFSVPDGDRWEGSTRSFVLASLQAGPDASLVELDEYLFGGSSRECSIP